jgi:hypothetical protein
VRTDNYHHVRHCLLLSGICLQRSHRAETCGLRINSPEYLHAGANAFRDKIQARMKQLVLYTLVGSRTSKALSSRVRIRIHHSPAKVLVQVFRHSAAAL